MAMNANSEVQHLEKKLGKIFLHTFSYPSPSAPSSVWTTPHR